MADGMSQVRAIHAWLRIYLVNWQEGYPPSENETEWIHSAMRIVRESGSLSLAQDCVMGAIMRKPPPRRHGTAYGLDSFRRDFALFKERYFNRPNGEPG